MKVKEILIPKTVYESVDGKEFDTELGAKIHDCDVYFDEHMRDRYCSADDYGYCIINSKEELDILQTLSINRYVGKGFFSHYLDKDIEFPIMVKFKDTVGMTKPTQLVDKRDYEWFKHMSETYQTLVKLYELSVRGESNETK